MNERHQRFVEEYVKDWNATQAAIRAGYSQDSAGAQAHELLKNVEIAEAVAAKRQELTEAAHIDALWVLQQWVEIATANPNDLIQHKNVNCRFCWGILHNYQWTEQGYMREVNRCIEKRQEPPDGMGGFGYDPNREPNPVCPECGGRGEECITIADTAALTGPARRLYAGIHKTRDGVRVLMRDQDAALGNIAKYLGMLVDKKEITGAGGGPVSLVNLKAEDLTDEQLLALIEAGDGKAAERG